MEKVRISPLIGWKRCKSGVAVIEDRDGGVFPIEVKSGKSYKRPNAITNVMDIENYHLKTGYVFCSGNIERAGKLLYLPIYLVSLLRND